MARTRILLVDDSATTRLILSRVLSGDPQLEIAGTAENGLKALSAIEELRPDVVILDLVMPEMDGLTALAELRRTHARLPVIIFSHLTHRGVKETVEALLLGADDYVPKPEPGDSFEAVVRGQLIGKIKACARIESAPHRATSDVRTSPPASAKTTDVIVIAASTGGPNALAHVLPCLPDGHPPVLIVQHMPSTFTGYLADSLTAKTGKTVREAVDRTVLRKGQIWLAPGNQHVLVEGQGSIRIRLSDAPPRNACRPSADLLFESAAEVFGAASLAVVLSGMGQDGLQGARKLADAKATIVAQDAATSIAWGMPGAVAQDGLADRVLALNSIGHWVAEQLSKERASRTASVAAVTETPFDAFDYVRELVRQRTGNVLGRDKKYLFQARLAKMARRHNAEDVEQLINHLRRDGDEEMERAVVENMLTNETSFFRDPNLFDELADSILPEIIASRRDRRQLNIWCGACSAGQEPYSIAMLLSDRFQAALEGWRVRLIASDYSRSSLDRARSGLYSKAEVDRGISPARLAGHLNPRGTRWQLNESLLAAVELMEINLIDVWPRLPKIDLLLLRNVLVYMDVATRQRILRRTRDVLANDGVLVLGAAEAIYDAEMPFQHLPRGSASCYRPRQDS